MHESFCHLLIIFSFLRIRRFSVLLCSRHLSVFRSNILAVSLHSNVVQQSASETFGDLYIAYNPHPVPILVTLPEAPSGMIWYVIRRSRGFVALPWTSQATGTVADVLINSIEVLPVISTFIFWRRCLGTLALSLMVEEQLHDV